MYSVIPFRIKIDIYICICKSEIICSSLGPSDDFVAKKKMKNLKDNHMPSIFFCIIQVNEIYMLSIMY